MSLKGVRKLAPDAGKPQKTTNSTRSTLRLLTDLAAETVEINKLIKELEEQKKEVRGQIFIHADDSYDGKDYLLPLYSVAIPKEFVETEDALPNFLDSRFPSWALENYKYDESLEQWEVLMKRRREFMPFVYEDEGFVLSRSVAENTPELDWNLMAKLEPDLFQKIAKAKVVFELDEDQLGQAIGDDPELATRIQLYAIHKKPTLRILAKVKNE